MRPGLYTRRDQLKRLSLGGTRYLLAEMPFSPIPMEDVFDYVELIFDQGLIPVIAHPERYAYFQENYDIPNLLLEKGAVLQVTAQSLVGAFGPKPMKLAQAMLRADAIDCLAPTPMRHTADEGRTCLQSGICFLPRGFRKACFPG